MSMEMQNKDHEKRPTGCVSLSSCCANRYNKNYSMFFLLSLKVNHNCEIVEMTYWLLFTDFFS